MNTRLIVGAALAAALALPTAAQADTSLVGGPLKVRDYEMTVIGSDAARDSVTVLFSRTAGKSSQQHLYSFDSGVTVTPTSITGSLGRYGAIDLKLSGARAAKGALPAGCTGNPGTTRRGTLTGSFKLVADSTYLRTVTAKSLAGMASTGGKVRCDGAGADTTGTVPGGSNGPMLSLTKTDAEGMFTFSASAKAQSAMRMDDAGATAPARLMHIISSPGAGLKGSSVPGISPFFGGAGTFQGDVSGTVSGDLVAKFDSIGPVRVEGDATMIG